MLEAIKGKKAIFFDVGYTLVHPLSGDWMFTRKLRALAGNRVDGHSPAEIRRAMDASIAYLEAHHRMRLVEEECRQFVLYYSELSKRLDLGLTPSQVQEAAYDRVLNMDNYVLYPDAKRVLTALGPAYTLGVISDTWPSVSLQLSTLGVAHFFTTHTYSFSLGVFKPDARLYEDALSQCGFPAEETAFVDDSPRNLAGAAALGITPILIAANPASDVDSPYVKIHSLSELLA